MNMNNEERLQMIVSMLGKILTLVYTSLDVFEFELSEQLTYRVSATTSSEPIVSFAWTSRQTGSPYKWMYLYGGSIAIVSVINPRGQQEHIYNVTVEDVAAGVISMMRNDNMRDAIDAIEQSVDARMNRINE